jgi:hypothetical protein
LLLFGKVFTLANFHARDGSLHEIEKTYLQKMKYTYKAPKLLLLTAIALFFTGCQKTDKGCWQAFDPASYGDAPGLVLCDKTLLEAQTEYPQYWFYQQGEDKFCWKVQLGSQASYAAGIPTSMTLLYKKENDAYQFTKVDCQSFCVLEWHEKHKSKITGQFGPTRLITETILSADSCSKLSVGRVVVVRETADSLITREVAKKTP